MMSIRLSFEAHWGFDTPSFLDQGRMDILLRLHN